MAAAPVPAARQRPPQVLRSDLGTATVAGAVASIALLGALVFWAWVTPIGGAVIAQGQAVVRGNAKLVQSLDGGLVKAIYAENGDQVAEGQVVLSLDPTLLQANLDIALNRLAAALARAARLQSEQVGLAEPAFTYDRLPFALPDMMREEEGQRRIFAARAEVMTGRRAQLAERLAQLGSQRTGLDGLIASKQNQLALIGRELANVRALYDQGLARESQLLDLQRGEAELLGQLAGHRSELAQLAMAGRDAELEVVQAERSFREQVVTELRETRTEAEELVLEIISLLRQLDRIEVRAPVAGVVHEMQASTVGGVIAPGAVILQVVPLAEGVVFEARVDPRQIDQVHTGQTAHVVFPAFDQRTTPRLAGQVGWVSPTAITDPATGQTYYRIELSIPPGELARLGNARPIPGMPVEAFLETTDRSVLDYLLLPLQAQIARAFRED